MKIKRRNNISKGTTKGWTHIQDSLLNIRLLKYRNSINNVKSPQILGIHHKTEEKRKKKSVMLDQFLD